MIIADKKELRKKMMSLRGQLSESERNRAEILITERLLGHQWFYRAEILLAYASYGSELSTNMLLQEALKQNKKVYLPKVSGNEMQFYRIDSLKDLQKGYKGIPEPVTNEKFEYNRNIVDKCLMLMPGLAFDVMKNRLGYGKGFYDRYLADKEDLQLKTIAIGFRCQLLEEIPVDENDIRPYQIICV